MAPATAANPSEIECEHAKLNTEDATPVGTGEWEFELSYGLLHSRRQFDDDWSRVSRPLLREEALGLALTHGVARDLDLGLAVGYAELYDRDTGALDGRGFTDLEVGAKWRFYRDSDSRLELAYTPAVVLPTGRREDDDRLGLTDDFLSVYNGIAASKDWGGRWTSNFDLGYSWPIGEDRHDFRGTLSSNVALGYQLNGWLQPEVELNYEHEFHHGHDADSLAATAGLIVCLTESVRLDIGVQRSIAGRNADHGSAAAAALTFAF
jgi:hypothetical protein